MSNILVVHLDHWDFINRNKWLILAHFKGYCNFFSSFKSFHCPSPKKMPFSKMDPSCTIGFYSKNVEHYERISNELSKVGKSFKKQHVNFHFKMTNCPKKNLTEKYWHCKLDKGCHLNVCQQVAAFNYIIGNCQTHCVQLRLL